MNSIGDGAAGPARLRGVWIRACMVLPVLVTFLSASGCAEKGPILLSLAYRQPEGTSIKVSTATVAVSPFIDKRGMEPSVLGERTIPDGQKNPLVVQGSVADIVTSLLKTALRERGISVANAPPWDLSEEAMKPVGAALLLGGEIRTLRLESTASTFKTHLKAAVRLKVVVGDGAEGKIIRSIDVNSTLEQDVLYSREKLEQAVSEALSSGIHQIFEDESLKKRLP